MVSAYSLQMKESLADSFEEINADQAVPSVPDQTPGGSAIYDLLFDDFFCNPNPIMLILRHA
jgi:hypothetical protein